MDLISFRLVTGTVAFSLCFFLGTYIYFRHRANRLNKVFALSAITLGLWNFNDILMVVFRNDPYLLTIDRLSYFAGVGAIYFINRLCVEISDIRFESIRMKRTLAFLSILMAGMMLTPWVLREVKVTNFIEEVPGPLYPIFVIFFFFVIGNGLFAVFRGYRIADGVKKNQLIYMVFAMFFGCFAAVSYFVTLYYRSISPIFYIPEIAFIGIMAYAVVRRRSMEINFVFRYGLIRLLFALLFGLPTMLLVFWTESIQVFCTAVLFAYLTAASLFPKTEAFLTSIVDSLPSFRKKYKRYATVSELQNLITGSQGVLEWGATFSKVIHDLVEASHVAILIKDVSMKCYLVKASNGLDQGAAAFLSIPFSSPLAQHFNNNTGSLLIDSLDEYFDKKTAEIMKNDLESIHAEIVLPLYFKGDLHAVLAIGPKVNNAMYNDLDIASIHAITRSAEHTLQALIVGQTAAYHSAGWAHDLLHPFGPKGSIQLLEVALNGKFGPMNEDLKQALSMVQKDVQFISHHILRIITPNVPTTYKILPNSPIGVFSRMKEKYMMAALKNKIQWVVQLPPPTLFAMYDQDIIEYRVVTNLIENAFRHTPEGGLVELGYRLENEAFVVYVRDTGEGIKKEDQEKLFKRGIQLSPTASGMAGLGLYNVAQAIEAHNGKVWVESQYGNGSTFFFTLPFARGNVTV